MIFSKGSKLHIIDDDHRYTYLISSASFTQTVREASYSQNTIHETVLVDEAFVDTKSPVNINIDMHLGRDEIFLFKWMGLKEVTTGNVITGFQISMGALDVLESPDIYLESSGGVYKVTNAVLSTCSFSLGPKTVASVSLTGQGSKMELVPSVPAATNQTTQSSSTFYSSSIEVADVDRLNGVTIEYTRDLTWLGRKGVHQIGEVIYPFNPVVTRFSVAGSITAYTNPDSPLLWEGIRSVQITDSEFDFAFDRCMVSYRMDTTPSLHKTVIDYKLLPNTNSYINII
tara:strand:- start:690 stop:1547 length:858 start_codon:yes stop_codon:yes gene_type:complete